MRSPRAVDSEEKYASYLPVINVYSTADIIGFFIFGTRYPLNFELYLWFNASQSVKIESHASYIKNLSVLSKMGPNDSIANSIAANSLQVELLEVSL